MTVPGKLSRREQLLDAAMTLFARQGYAQTSVAEIQQACGLASSSGALYKHFASKRELLEAATQRYVQALAEDGKRFDAAATGDVEQALQLVATIVWENIDNNAVLLRIIYSERTFPELADQLWSAVTANAYQRVTMVLRDAVDTGLLRMADPEAMATLLLASLIHYPLIQLLINHAPGGIDEDRYRAAWVEHVRAITRACAAEGQP